MSHETVISDTHVGSKIPWETARPLAMQRLKSRLVVNGCGCWVWQGSVNRLGYGQLAVGTRRFMAHRLAYMLWKGEITPGLYVCHDCDNPRCCNPAHLHQGTAKQNMQEASARDRWGRNKITHCKHGHPLSGENVYRAPSKPNKRHCRTCMKIKAKRDWERIRSTRSADPTNAVRTEGDK